jgi:hypothetical protein
MNGDRVAALLVAVACVSAMGVASTTLDSSLDTDPDDVIDLDWQTLPLTEERASDLQQEVKQNQQTQQQRQGGAEQQQQKQQQQRRQRQQQQEEQQQETKPDERNLLERLWDLLLDLLPLLVLIGSLVAAAILVRRYWERLVGPLLALLPGGGSRQGRDRIAWSDREPRNEAERAWFEFVRRAGVDRPHAKTPRETAEAAVRSGFDSDAVDRLREAFEEARYSGRELTAAQRERLREVRDRFGERSDDDERRDREDGEAVTDGGAAASRRGTVDGGATANRRGTVDGGAAEYTEGGDADDRSDRPGGEGR